MITDHTSRHDQRLDTTSRRPWYRRSVVLVAAAVLLLIAVPAVAYLLDLDTPPLDQDFPPGEPGMTVYGADEGVGEYCAAEIAFRSNGAPVLGGQCGLLELDPEGNWVSMGGEIGTSGLVDMAVAPDGTVWVAAIDHELQSVAGGVVTTHGFTARAVEVTPDGAVYASKYDLDAIDELASLLRFDGSTWEELDVGPMEELVLGPEGVLHALGTIPEGYDPATGSADRWVPMIGTFDGDNYTVVPIPEIYAGGSATVDPDGTLWLIGGGMGEIIERQGVTDVQWALVKYDGADWSKIEIPFPEPIDVAVHPEGTVWVASTLYGAFAFDGDSWVRYSILEGLPTEGAWFVDVAPNGDVYVGTSLGIARITPEA